MANQRFTFSGHALTRMFERTISIAEVKRVIESGEIVTEYVDDKPFPSRLILGYIEERPIHVVVAFEEERSTWYVVTAYEPSLKIWEADFKRRKQP